MGFSIVGYIVVIPAVVLLLLVGNPPTIGRIIVAVNVDTVNGEIIAVAVIYRPIAERFKTFRPFLTDGDSTSTVVRISVVVRIVTSRFNFFPDTVDTGVAFAVFFVFFRRLFSVKTPAASRTTSREIACSRDDLVSAIATTPPCYVLSFVFGSFDDGKTSEALTCKVSQCWHFINTAPFVYN